MVGTAASGGLSSQTARFTEILRGLAMMGETLAEDALTADRAGLDGERSAPEVSEPVPGRTPT
jgi:hypothetical protein